ncbi:MAG: RNA polymerase sigma factor [Lachnospiraceae bacterium]|nr:RNA polymerase sigma factor [Lachnospiraceae bacterium]
MGTTISWGWRDGFGQGESRERLLAIHHRVRKAIERLLRFAAASAAGAFRKTVTREEANRMAEHLLSDYGESMLRLAYSYLHNYADAEEIVQDAVVNVVTKAPVFENPSHEKAYLMSTVSNLSKNKLQYNRVREADELSEELAAEEKQDLSFVWEAVKGLPERYREVVHLFYHEGYKTAEIAELLSRKEATVRSDLNRARGLLKDILKEAYDFE